MSQPNLINGVPADFWNESTVPLIAGVCSFFVVLAVLAIGLRFYSRVHARVPLWWDDWFALASVPFVLISPIISLVQIHNGMGRHQVVVLTTDPSKLEKYGFNLYLIVLFYNPGLAFFKYSFLALYIRLFSLYGWLRYGCYAMGTLITIWMVAIEFVLIFRCTPIKANWIPTAGTCIPYETILLTQSVPSIFFDLAMLALPIRVVMGLKMNRAARVGVIGVFLLGAVVALISIVRLAVLLHSSESDLTWGYVGVGLWSAAEPTVGLICCCLPTYAALLRALNKKISISWGSMYGRGRSKTSFTSRMTSSSTRDKSRTENRNSNLSYCAGYEPSGDDSDAFQLMDANHAQLANTDTHERDPEWNATGFHVTRELPVDR